MKKHLVFILVIFTLTFTAATEDYFNGFITDILGNPITEIQKLKDNGWYETGVDGHVHNFENKNEVKLFGCNVTGYGILVTDDNYIYCEKFLLDASFYKKDLYNMIMEWVIGHNAVMAAEIENVYNSNTNKTCEKITFHIVDDLVNVSFMAIEEPPSHTYTVGILTEIKL